MTRRRRPAIGLCGADADGKVFSMRPVHSLVSLVLLAACFSESGGGGGTTNAECPDGSSGCPCYGNETCDDGLECSMGACVVPGCAPGELACNCFENQCFGALVCDGGACHEPPAATDGSGPGSDGAPTSGTSATTGVSMSVSDSMTTTFPTDTGVVSCGDEPDCEACKDCAAFGPCAEQLATCEMDPECAALVECLTPCRHGDDACASECALAHPDGTAAFEPYALCVICECIMPCEMMGTCGG